MKICGNVKVPLRYEFPLSERVRLLLRLEDSLRRITEQAYESAPEAHRYALVALCELLDLTQRIDLKAEVRSEAERLRHQLRSLRHRPDIRVEVLDGSLESLERVIHGIDASAHRTGSRPRDDAWLSLVRGRLRVPGGVTRFDMPSFNFWMAQDPVWRRERLLDWLADFGSVREGVEVALNLLRACSEVESLQAPGGLFQRPLGMRLPLLVGIDLSPDLTAIPEVSANRIALLVRFSRFSETTRPRPCEEEVSFGLAVAYGN